MKDHLTTFICLAANVPIGDDQEWIFTLPFPLIPMQSVSSYSSPFPSLSVIPIAMDIPIGLFPFPGWSLVTLYSSLVPML